MSILDDASGRNDVDCFLFPRKGLALRRAEQILGVETIIFHLELRIRAFFRLIPGERNL